MPSSNPKCLNRNSCAAGRTVPLLSSASSGTESGGASAVPLHAPAFAEICRSCHILPNFGSLELPSRRIPPDIPFVFGRVLRKGQNCFQRDSQLRQVPQRPAPRRPRLRPRGLATRRRPRPKIENSVAFAAQSKSKEQIRKEVKLSVC